MRQKGKQLKRIRRYRAANPLQRAAARLRYHFKRMRGVPVITGIVGYIDVNKQMAQPLPETIDIKAWHNEFDAMALCDIFGVPYELYSASQMNKL